jgi:branched-chain amino acid transport system substrate-binding protein
MRYTGSDDVTTIGFTDADKVSFDATAPQEEIQTTTDGLHYRRYHVTGDFKADYDLHQYPFDQQQLNIRFQNTHLTSEHLVYAIDTQRLPLGPDNVLEPSTGILAFRSLSSWVYLSTQYASDTFTTHSTLGKQENFDQRTQTDYSGLQVTMKVQRKSLSYLTSRLLPLALLFLLVYASLFLSHTEHLGDRLELVVAALLTSAVLLLSINSELPEIGYVVSIQYIYYVFFMLCFICIVVPMFMKWLDTQQHPRPLHWINIALHAFYIAVVATTIITHLVIYGNRLA